MEWWHRFQSKHWCLLGVLHRWDGRSEFEFAWPSCCLQLNQSTIGHVSRAWPHHIYGWFWMISKGSQHVKVWIAIMLYLYYSTIKMWSTWVNHTKTQSILDISYGSTAQVGVGPYRKSISRYWYETFIGHTTLDYLMKFIMVTVKDETSVQEGWKSATEPHY